MSSVCPSCRKPVTEKLPGVWPFCCKRCKMIDLGKWMAEDYRIPVVDPPSEDEMPLSEGSDESSDKD